MICPISGLTVHREPEWTDVYFEDNFKITADIIGDHILLTHSSGSATLEGARKAFEFTRQLIGTHLPDRPYVHLLNYSELKSVSLESRRFFISEMMQRPKLLGLVLFGLSPLMKINVKLGRRLNLIRFPVQIAKDYRQAIGLAQALLATRIDRSTPETAEAKAHVEGALFHRGARLPVVRRSEWTLETAEFRIRYEIIAGHIIHSVSSGYLRDIDLPQLIALRDEVVASVKPIIPPDYIIADMSGIRGYERRARKHYLSNLASTLPAQRIHPLWGEPIHCGGG